MTTSVRFLTLLSLPLIGCFGAFATESKSVAKTTEAVEYKPILNEKTTACSKPAYCRINEPGDEVYLVWFEVSKEPNDELRELKKVGIKNAQTGDVQTFKFDDIARVETNEPFKFLKTQLRKDGPTDLALYASQSSKDGELYYFFIFNPKTKKFELTREQAPLVDRSADGKRFVGQENSDFIYELDSKLQLNLNVSETRAAHKKSDEGTGSKATK